jgi:hypothetical protein
MKNALTFCDGGSFRQQSNCRQVLGCGTRACRSSGALQAHSAAAPCRPWYLCGEKHDFEKRTQFSSQVAIYQHDTNKIISASSLFKVIRGFQGPHRRVPRRAEHIIPRTSALKKANLPNEPKLKNLPTSCESISNAKTPRHFDSKTNPNPGFFFMPRRLWVLIRVIRGFKPKTNQKI